MHGVGVIALKEPFAEESLLTPAVGDLQADAGRLVVLPQGELSDALYVPEPEEVIGVERGLADVLDLRRLVRPSPLAPQPVPGVIDYPRWGHIYWASGLGTGENKRYVVVSNDRWNKQTKAPIIVRMTTQPKRRAEDFPEVQDGDAQACCGEATSVAHAVLNQRQRPSPPSLPLRDMSAVAGGLMSVLELGG